MHVYGGLVKVFGIVAIAAGGFAALAQEVFVLDGAVKMSPAGQIFSRAGKMAGYEHDNSVFDGLVGVVRLAGARGERLDFQIMIKAGAQSLAGVEAAISEITGPGGAFPAGRVKLFRQWHINVTQPSESPAGSAGAGWYPDPLIPADVPKYGLPVDVEAGKIQGVWADVLIPRNAKPGTYSGRITVAAGQRQLAVVPLELRVYDFEMPAERHLRWRIGYCEWESVPAHYGIAAGSDEWLKIEEDLYRLCWEDCRFAPTTHYNPPHLPSSGKGRDFKYQWDKFDQRFGKYLDGSAFEDKQPVNIVSLPINVEYGCPTGGKAIDGETLEAAVRDVVAHWKAKGWRLEDTLVYIADEPKPDRYPAMQKACETILKASGGRIRTSVAFYTHFGQAGAELVKQFAGYVTMWDIAGDCIPCDGKAFGMLKERQRAGDFIGFYQGSEPHQGCETLDGDGLALTTWPWIAWRYGLDTLYLYNMTEWSYFRAAGKSWGACNDIWINPLNQGWICNSQGVLLYPGQKVGVRGFIPSIRMKQIRRGMQDYEYFWLLSRKKGGKAKADDICKRIMPKALHEGGEWGKPPLWERDPRQWSMVREEMARAIQE